jgi:putative redox protein
MRAVVRCPDRGAPVGLRIEGARGEDASAAGGPGAEPAPDEVLAASLAACTATTMELYSRRKGWEVGEIEVRVDYTPAQAGSPPRCSIVVRLPEHLSPDQRERLMQVGSASELHRVLAGEAVYEERVEPVTAPVPVDADRGSEPPRRRIALLNGLWGALRAPQP